MEKDRSSKVIAIAALLVGVVALSVGFARFSTTLNIGASANVNPTGENFKVEFSTDDEVLTAGTLAGSGTNGATAGDATIVNITDENPTPKITGLVANFTEPGQTVTYTFYAHNSGEFLAYLRSISFANVEGKNLPKVCTAAADVTDSYVQSACNGITITVDVGADTDLTESTSAFSGHSLSIGAFEEVTVTIDYASGSAKADGDFTVAFGDITLGYSSIDS